MNVLELFDAVNSGPVAPGTRQDDEKMLDRIGEQFARMQRKLAFYEKHARIPSRKWEIPMSAVTWLPQEDGYRNGTITTPSDAVVEICLHPYNDTLPGSASIADQAGYIGLSIHGEMLHLGTPGFALSLPFVAAMEELERAGIAHPLPTKIGVLDADGNEVKMIVYAPRLPDVEPASRY